MNKRFSVSSNVNVQDLDIPESVKYRVMSELEQVLTELVDLRSGNDRAEEMLAAANIMATGQSMREETAQEVKAALMERLAETYYLPAHICEELKERIETAVAAGVQERKSGKGIRG